MHPVCKLEMERPISRSPSMRIELISDFDDDTCSVDQLNGYSAAPHLITTAQKFFDKTVVCVRSVMGCFNSFHRDVQHTSLHTKASMPPSQASISPLGGVFL